MPPIVARAALIANGRHLTSMRCSPPLRRRTRLSAYIGPTCSDRRDDEAELASAHKLVLPPLLEAHDHNLSSLADALEKNRDTLRKLGLASRS